jgi:RND family efflux transporter MFP subunit
VRTVSVTEVTEHTRAVWLTGRLHAARRSALGFERQGKLISVRVDDGDTVAAGQVLAELDTSTLERRRRELVAKRESTKARLELARRTERRQQRLVEQGHASEQRYDEARLDARALAAQVDELSAAIAGIDLDIAKSSLQAPFAGRVQSRTLDEGAVVAPGEPVLTLMETRRLEARVGIPADKTGDLDLGESYPLRVDGTIFRGRLSSLSPDMAAETRTVTAVFDLGAPAAGAIGELVRLRLTKTVKGRGYWLPRGALSEDIRGLWSVYTLVPVPDGEGFKLQRESVEVVETDGNRVFARGSLDPGRRIVAEGVNRVVPGQRVVPVSNVETSRTGAAETGAPTTGTGAGK